jgi:hypothetical protein
MRLIINEFIIGVEIVNVEIYWYKLYKYPGGPSIETIGKGVTLTLKTKDICTINEVNQIAIHKGTGVLIGNAEEVTGGKISSADMNMVDYDSAWGLVISKDIDYNEPQEFSLHHAQRDAQDRFVFGSKEQYERNHR